VWNNGELPAPFILKFNGYMPKNTIIQIGDNKLRIEQGSYNTIVNT
jgi:hypothetical protein